LLTESCLYSLFVSPLLQQLRLLQLLLLLLLLLKI